MNFYNYLTICIDFHEQLLYNTNVEKISYIWRESKVKVGNISAFGTWDSKKDRIPKSSSTELRSVNSFEIELIVSGNGTIFLNDKRCPIIPNLLVVAKPGQQRSSIFHFKTYVLHIDIDKNFEFYNNVNNLPDFICTTHPSSYIQLFSNMIIFLLENNKKTDNIYFNSKFLELICLLETDALNSEKIFTTGNMRKTHIIISQVVDYISKHFHDKISLNDLAEVTNYSPNYIQNIFSVATGMSPNEYLSAERIKQAKALLINTDSSIADVAYACGFSSQAYFAKVFKKNVFCTPLEYRNMIQNSI